MSDLEKPDDVPRAAVLRYLAPVFEGPAARAKRGVPARFRALDERSKVALLSLLAAGFTVTTACKRVGITPTTVYAEKERDPAFDEAYESARDAGTDMLVEEARRRAVEGVSEPVYHQGKLVGEKRKYSDTLLLGLLGARDPTFRKSAQAQGAMPPDDPTVNVGVVVVPGQSESPDAWADEVRKAGVVIDAPVDPEQEEP